MKDIGSLTVCDHMELWMVLVDSLCVPNVIVKGIGSLTLCNTTQCCEGYW